MSDQDLITQCVESLKNDPVVIDMFKDFGTNIEEIDLIPICFVDDLEVSARTEHGIVYLNSRLKDNFKENYHYVPHELGHNRQQTTGDKPTKGSTDDNYLDNKYEQEGFQYQTEYISEHEGPEKAEQYIEKVMDHHQIPESEQEKTKEKLLSTAQQLKIDFPKKDNPEVSKEEGLQKLRDLAERFDETISKVDPKNFRTQKVKLLPEFERKYRLKRLQQILDNLK